MESTVALRTIVDLSLERPGGLDRQIGVADKAYREARDWAAATHLAKAIQVAREWHLGQPNAHWEPLEFIDFAAWNSGGNWGVLILGLRDTAGQTLPELDADAAREVSLSLASALLCTGSLPTVRPLPADMRRGAAGLHDAVCGRVPCRYEES